mmetsp:Transcript_2216/g.5632  ORF Transcript_2216/g.5632 Transcript_2216/m.5632 type:complete len:231 (-) Transcript_2216:121-813(-)
MTKKVLIVCTSCDKLGNTDAGTGCWMEELAAPYYVFKAAGCEVTVVSIKGGEIPMDEASLNPPFLTKEAEKFILDDECMALVSESKPVTTVTDFTAYDAIFMPGGHGACYDLPTNEVLVKGLGAAWDAGKVVAAVCHGPVVFANVKAANGEPIVKGKKVTGFSNAEEQAVAKDDLVPFSLEDKLKELGGIYEAAAEKWAPHVVRDGKLVTGQNPASSHGVAEQMVAAMSS